MRKPDHTSPIHVNVSRPRQRAGGGISEIRHGRTRHDTTGQGMAGQGRAGLGLRGGSACTVHSASQVFEQCELETAFLSQGRPAPPRPAVITRWACDRVNI